MNQAIATTMAAALVGMGLLAAAPGASADHCVKEDGSGREVFCTHRCPDDRNVGTQVTVWGTEIPVCTSADADVHDTKVCTFPDLGAGEAGVTVSAHRTTFTVFVDACCERESIGWACDEFLQRDP